MSYGNHLFLISDIRPCPTRQGNSVDLCNKLGAITREDCLKDGYGCGVWLWGEQDVTKGKRAIYYIATIKLATSTATKEKECCEMIRDIDNQGNVVFG